VSIPSTIVAYNGIQECDKQAGGTADAQINNAVGLLPANGGTVDCRGYGATTQVIANTVNVGTNTKTVTLLLDRTTTFNCTITNNTPCFQKAPGSSMVGLGSAITNPNGGINFASNAAISAAIFDQQQNGGNFVGSYIDGLSLFGNATMTVSDALISLQCPLQVTNLHNLNVGGGGLQNAILLKIYGTTSCGAGNVSVENTQIDGAGAFGARPVWIGCTSAGSTIVVACPGGVGNISFSGKGSAYTHPGTGAVPIFDIECGNGLGGWNTCGGFEFSGLQIESRFTGNSGILAAGPESIHIYGLYGSCNTQCGTDLIAIGGTNLDGVDIRGVDNQGGWTNTLHNTVVNTTFPFTTAPRINYTFSGSNRVENVMDSGGLAFGAGVTVAFLGTPANGTIIYCSDCTIANPCAGGGTGALAKRLNGVWVCN
jgi:hypothetical protein